MRILHKLFLFWKNFFLPHRCIFCRRHLILSAEVGICPDCMEELPFCLSYRRCQACGRPVPDEEPLCYRCSRNRRNYYRKVCAAYLYEDTAKKALLRFKREQHQNYAPVFAVHIAASLKCSPPCQEFDLVVAVPPRKQRLSTRIYDQAGTLGEAVARELRLPYAQGVLRQVEVRQKQSDLTYAERWGNVLGNYTVIRKNAVKEKRILLVDDICTTGATLNECAKVLKASGATTVSCAVAAIAGEEKFF